MAKKSVTSSISFVPIKNPDKSVMKHWLATTKFFPVSTGARKGTEQHALQVNVKLRKITFNRGNEKFRLPFDALGADRSIERKQLVKVVAGPDGKEATEPASQEDIQFFLGEEDSNEWGDPFFDAFKSSKQQLIDQIFAVRTHEEMFKELYNPLSHPTSQRQVQK